MEVTLLSSYFDERNGGIGSYSNLIYESFLERGVDVKTISQLQCIISPNSVHYSPRSLLSYLIFFTTDIKRIMNKKEYKNSDIFHALSPMESLYIPKNKGVSSVLDFIPLEDDAVSFQSKVFVKYFKKAINSTVECEQIIANNSDIKQKLIEDWGAESTKIEVIPPIMDSKYFPTNQKHDLFTIGTISGLDSRKRQSILIKSFLEADIEDSQLLIGGKGRDYEKLKNLANGDERIKFLGFVESEYMNNFYNSLDLFVFPTIKEGYGMPMVEAMGCGKPVITLDDADIPSNIKKRTYVCSKEELSDVISNRTYKCDIKENIKFFKQHSKENVSKKLLKIYEDVVN